MGEVSRDELAAMTDQELLARRLPPSPFLTGCIFDIQVQQEQQ